MNKIDSPAPSADTIPLWSLSDLYEGRTDPNINADLNKARDINQTLAGQQGDLLALRHQPAELGVLLDQIITSYEEATNWLWRVGSYSGLAASTSRDDPDWSRFETDIRTQSSEIAADSLFVTLEINQLENTEIEAALEAHPPAAKWRPWLRRVRAGRPHELSAELEHYLMDRSPAVSNWVRLFDETLGELEIPVGNETLSLTSTLARLSHPGDQQRREAAAGLSEALGARQETLALCLNTIIFEKQVEDRWRKFARPLDSRNLANEIEFEAVDALVSAVRESYPRISHRYYQLKARALGKTHLDHWDRNAPLTKDPGRSYEWEESRDLILESFASLSPNFATSAKRMFDMPWIDARARGGKQSGAYSHPVTAAHHPYVFLNFMGDRRDVLTLAHELGHAVHQQLAAPLGTLLADTPLTLAETASIFGEALVFERLLEGAQGQERLGLLAGRIEDGLNTVVRQIAFHQFETRIHSERAKGELSCDRLSAIWLDVMGESLGPAFRLDEGYGVYWSYVSHFVRSPFYVYAYAFGDLLVRALVEARNQDPEGFTAKYEKLLADGGTRTCVEALADFGLDPRDKNFWLAGCRQLERLVEEFDIALGHEKAGA
jgi:oligoendopeptidase F